MTLKTKCKEFPRGTAGKGSSIVTAAVWVQSVAWEFTHAEGPSKKKKKGKDLMDLGLCPKTHLRKQGKLK